LRRLACNSLAEDQVDHLASQPLSLERTQMKPIKRLSKLTGKLDKVQHLWGNKRPVKIIHVREDQLPGPVTIIKPESKS
jgi:hypothetical protein